MPPRLVALALALSVAALPLVAQAEGEDPQESAPAAPAAPSAAPAAQPAPAAGAPARQDALLLYRQGRDLETAGKLPEAQAKYAQSVAVCDQELASDSRRVEAYVVKCWSLFRLGKYSDVVSTGQAGLKVAFDARISEAMGESYYFLGQMDSCLKYLQKYIEVAGDQGDRGPTALFFMGEAYLRQKKYSHADIAYSAALSREPSMPRWWFRLGNALEGSGEWKRAADAYGKALALSPSYQEAQSGQARAKAKIAQ
jgi:tetratricopeptide (TPR) repeat protein